MPAVSTWLPWALLSAVFAAVTATFAKVGLEGIDPDFRTRLRGALRVVKVDEGRGGLEPDLAGDALRAGLHAFVQDVQVSDHHLAHRASHSAESQAVKPRPSVAPSCSWMIAPHQAIICSLTCTGHGAAAWIAIPG